MTPADVARFLPEVHRAALVPDSPALALTGLMAHCLTPLEGSLSRLDEAFSPYRAPAEFVPYLASWVDMGEMLTAKVEGPDGSYRTLSSGHGRLRELVALAADLSRLRGTAEGLERMLEVATGCHGFRIEESNDRPYHFHVVAPAAAEPHHLLVDHIAGLEKPAYVTYSVSYERDNTEQSDAAVAV